MALGDIRFTEQQRKHLHYLLMTLVFSQALIGLVLFLLGVCVTSSVGSNLHSVDRMVVNWVFAILAMYGFYILTHNLVGAKLCSNFIRFAEWYALKMWHKDFVASLGSGTNLRLFVWTLIGVIAVGVGCVLASVCVVTADHLVSQIHRSLYRGMMQYLTDSAWKATLDQMQVQMKCCGIESFTDWYKTYWMHHDVLDEDSPIILKYAELDGRILPPVVPWSCCRLDAKSPCYHDPLQLPSSDQDLVTDTLHTEGCLTAMKGPVVGALFFTIALVILLFTVQVAITVLSRLAFTAARNSVALGNRYGPSPGWLYGRLDFGNATGPNLCQIYRVSPSTVLWYAIIVDKSAKIFGKCSGRGDVMIDLKPLVYTSDAE